MNLSEEARWAAHSGGEDPPLHHVRAAAHRTEEGGAFEHHQQGRGQQLFERARNNLNEDAEDGGRAGELLMDDLLLEEPGPRKKLRERARSGASIGPGEGSERGGGDLGAGREKGTTASAPLSSGPNTSGEQQLCSVCLEPIAYPTLAPCGHCFCRPCIYQVLNNKPPRDVGKCPLCREVITLVSLRNLETGAPIVWGRSVDTGDGVVG